MKRGTVWKWTKRTLWSLGLVVIVAYIGLCVWVRVNETRLIFIRNRPYIPPSPSLALNQQRVEFADAEGTKFFAWVVPNSSEDTSKLWVLFFHGSEENVSIHSNDYDDFRSMGFSIMAPEYPGYLDSPGVPGESIIEREAQAAYDYLRRIKQVPPGNIVIYGYSLGSAVAINLASHVEAAALIILSGFSSMVSIGQHEFPFLPIRLLLKNKFESDITIGRVNMPVLVIHSTEYDRFHPFPHGQRLYDLAPFPKQLLRIRGGPTQGPLTSALVNPNFFSEIATFLNAHTAFHLHQPLPSIAPVIAATIDSNGIEASVAQYRSLRTGNPNGFNFREAELSRLGAQLLRQKKTNEAITVLKLNAEQYPQSFSVFDSLGDAYVAAGNTAEAMRNYQQSVTLFPDNQNSSRVKLDELQRKSASALP
jgi:pimeloyl-ACP methyl ester carboxylesterase